MCGTYRFVSSGALKFLRPVRRSSCTNLSYAVLADLSPGEFKVSTTSSKLFVHQSIVLGSCRLPAEFLSSGLQDCCHSGSGPCCSMCHSTSTRITSATFSDRRRVFDTCTGAKVPISKPCEGFQSEFEHRHVTHILVPGPHSHPTSQQARPPSLLVTPYGKSLI